MDTSIIWKKIPLELYYDYEVSSYGDVRVVNNDGSFSLLNVYSKDNYYKDISLKILDGTWHKFLIHRLVALAFIPLPEEGKFQKLKRIPRDGVPYQVNHIDYDPSNNYYTNLEWCDSFHNTSHSYLFSYKTRTINCILRDIMTGEEIEFKNGKDLSEYLGVTPSSISTIIVKHTEIPFLGRYTFRYDNMLIKANAVKQSIICKDYTTNNIFVTETIKEMSLLTGLRVPCITSKLTNERYGRNYNKDTMTSGYVIMYVKDHDGTWPNYSIEEAELSRLLYVKRLTEGETKTSKKIICKDYLTGEYTLYPSLTEAANDIQISKMSLSNYISRDDFQLYDGKVFRFEWDERDWPEYSDEEIRRSKEIKRLIENGVRWASSNRPIKGKYYPTGETKDFLSISDASKQLAFNRKSIQPILDPNKSNLFYKGWSFKYSSDSSEWPILT